jgi:NADH:ubiquinone oxidoreductase subunit 5 (subunit L)/multisubunit Na+/H+ antiporter MnhA subunit
MVDDAFLVLAILVLANPAVLVAAVGLSALLRRPLSERETNRLTYATTVAGLLSSIAVLALMLVVGTRHVSIELGNWVVIPEQHFHFHLKFVFDRLSVPFVILSFSLCGIVAAFASRYLHREAGFARFHVCFAMFLLGMVMSSLACRRRRWWRTSTNARRRCAMVFACGAFIAWRMRRS